MIADGKRCEFAENLRRQAGAWRDMVPDIPMSGRSPHDSIHMAFGPHGIHMPAHGALDMLADLIEGKN